MHSPGTTSLEKATQWMAHDLAGRQTLDHTDSQQREMATRLLAFGYDRPRLLAENIAEGQETPVDVVNSWLRSPPHRATLLHPEAREAGIGQARSGAGRRYWVLDLAAPLNDR